MTIIVIDHKINGRYSVMCNGEYSVTARLSKEDNACLKSTCYPDIIFYCCYNLIYGMIFFRNSSLPEAQQYINQDCACQRH